MDSTDVVYLELSSQGKRALDIVRRCGNARLRLAADLAYGAELTFEEISSLRPASFNLSDETVVLKDENGAVVRVCYFLEFTIFEYFEWMAERSVNLEDTYWDSLLHDDHEQPSTPASLLAEFEELVCRHSTPAELQLGSFSESDFITREVTRSTAS